MTLPKLVMPVCESCGERVFTNEVDEQINAEIRRHLRLLTPDQIREALDRIHMDPREAANRMGIAESALSHWINGARIQTRAMDQLLRVFFAFPQVRSALTGETQDPMLGNRDVSTKQTIYRASEN
ncbi:MAG: hypothetical protein U1D30_18275 [Planctomycetota bacterium]